MNPTHLSIGTFRARQFKGGLDDAKAMVRWLCGDGGNTFCGCVVRGGKDYEVEYHSGDGNTGWVGRGCWVVLTDDYGMGVLPSRVAKVVYRFVDENDESANLAPVAWATRCDDGSRETVLPWLRRLNEHLTRVDRSHRYLDPLETRLGEADLKRGDWIVSYYAGDWPVVKRLSPKRFHELFAPID